jgi:membrane protease YdiL (CAAX protease family)
MLPVMGSKACGDVLKVWLYAAASVLLGAWLSPFLYNAGKALAEVSSAKKTNGLLEWLAGVCRAAAFPTFFEAALILAALILFLPFIHFLQSGRTASLNETARARTEGQRLQKNPRGPGQGLIGFLLVTVLFLLIGVVLVLAGVFEWKAPGKSLAGPALVGFVTALGLAIIQEVLFRGIAMGIFLRAMRPVAAILMVALLFALVHALHPLAGVTVKDPDASGVGFELLRNIAAFFSQPQVLFGTFAPMIALGGVLSYARWRTASLFLPIGLHTGWIFINDLLDSVLVTSSRPDSAMWVISGGSLRQGLVPLAGILVAGVLTNYLAGRHDPTDSPA